MKIRQTLADEIETIEIREDLAVSLYNLGTVPILSQQQRQEYLERFLEISSNLYQRTSIHRYEMFVKEGQKSLRDLST
jgi:hypothetical protein